MVRSIALIITTVAALSGWGTILYNWLTSTPKIKGQILNLMTADWANPQWHKPKTSLFVYLYLINERKNPVHILDYELEFDLGNGYERALRVYGTQRIEQPSFHSDMFEIAIPNFKDKLIYSKNNPVEYGTPLHGFALFATDKPHNLIMGKIRKLKVTCIDAFKDRHIIEATPEQFSNIYLLQDIAGIEIKEKTTNQIK